MCVQYSETGVKIQYLGQKQVEARRSTCVPIWVAPVVYSSLKCG